jgi:DNA-binding NarL/FixJ family response regulator
MSLRSLSGRERQIATLLSNGKSGRQIQEELHIAKSTFESHKANLYRKLNIHCVAMLTRAVVEHERRAEDLGK